MLRFLRDMFRTAGETAQLTQRCLFLEQEREKLEWKVEQLEKEVKSERRRFDSFQKTYFNQISVRNGLYGAFRDPDEADKPAVVQVLPPEITVYDEETLINYAQQLRDEDRARGIDRPLEMYLQKMREAPERYLDNFN